MESSTGKMMEWLWVHLYVEHWLTLFMYFLKRIGYEIVHLTLTSLLPAVFVLLASPEHSEAFQKFLNGRHVNM